MFNNPKTEEELKENFEFDDQEISNLVEQMMEKLGADHAFGRPIKAEAKTIIPIAEVRTGFGFGFGREKKNRINKPNEGRGGGSGGGGKVVPVGYIQADKDGVTFHPLINRNKLAMAGIVLSGWGLWLLSRIIKKR